MLARHKAAPSMQAQRWFEAGQHEGDTQFAAKMSGESAVMNLHPRYSCACCSAG